MEIFEIDQMGVQEINNVDLETVDGGSLVVFLVACVVTYILVEAAANPNATAASFKAGWNAA